MSEFAFYHECEVCKLRLLLTPEIAYQGGWDYPPRMGEWGIVSPRTCGNCGIEKTVYWKLAVEKVSINDLSEEDYQTALRMTQERNPYAPAQ